MEKKIKVKYVGTSQVRVIDDYRWDASNDWVQAVPLALAAELMTYPRPDFRLVDEADEGLIAKALERKEA